MNEGENYRRSMDFVRGKPSRGLPWVLDAGLRCFTATCGNPPDKECVRALKDELGCMEHWVSARPFAEIQKNLEIKTSAEGEDTVNEYRCRGGVLTERKRGKQCIEHMIKDARDFGVFVSMCEDTEIVPDAAALECGRKLAAGRCALAMSARASPVQELIQHKTGVSGFYYLLMDDTALVEHALEVMQGNQRRRYEIMKAAACDLFYQSENTSTTMISPAYYEKYSLPQISEFVSCAHSVGVPAFVHMCGLLNDLLPLLKRTGMDGIHSLTPPTVGDVPFEDFYTRFAPSFPIFGRFGTVHWYGKTRDEIISELERVAPRTVFMEHPFMLLVTGDEVEAIPEENFIALREAIRVYEGG